ncbi:hypothetical protein B4168_4120 [Anoxybacillus flavithermus]|nr:hypothetical protein B4168_4120 [Anoxybacillus flavithermus]OAO88358.1 hypothetical protein GT23_0451 [Parageobacillus thermoglucosidasius]
MVIFFTVLFVNILKILHCKQVLHIGMIFAHNRKRTKKEGGGHERIKGRLTDRGSQNVKK